MRKFILTTIVFNTSISIFGQSSDVKSINSIIDSKTALEPLHVLASDELKGRGTRRPEIHVAADYIAGFFKKSGVKQADSARNYFQQFNLKTATYASSGSLVVNNKTFNIGNELLQAGGKDASMNAPIVYVNFASREDLDKTDVKGKIVVSNFGAHDSSKVQAAFQHIPAKQMLLIERGAVAMIERVWQKDASWPALQNLVSTGRFVQQEDSIPVFLINTDSAFVTSLADAPTATIKSSGNSIRGLISKNVVGLVQGSDAKLKEQYIVLSAHYDHLGVAREPKIVDGYADSIYNGARDNAIGVAAVLNAAKYFSKNPPRRSILFILFTAEEGGLMGSRYYSEHPVIPMNKVVFNLNCDNGGYNDTSLVTVVGLGRTSADKDIQSASAQYGLRAISDPMPEQNLFDRSDNLNFAIKGVPAPTYGMGVTAFDSTIRKYYHQVSDEVSSFDLAYGLKYIRSYILAAKNIADNPTQPTWKSGDKYEEAWNRLFAK